MHVLNMYMYIASLMSSVNLLYYLTKVILQFSRFVLIMFDFNIPFLLFYGIIVQVAMRFSF